MDQHITDALIGLAVIIIGSLGTLIALLTERIKRHLDTNTQLTRETKKATNGTLTAVLDRLAAAQHHVLALQQSVRERDDRLAYLVAHLPAASRVLAGYQERRQTHPPPEEDLDDPTGTDAGAHPVSR